MNTRLLSLKKVLGSLLARIDPSWHPVFAPYRSKLTQISQLISSQEIAPELTKVMRVFELPISHYRAVIVGQDPYPTRGFANGLAFSVEPSITRLPASLRNIFTEYSSDTGFATPITGDLSAWSSAGVALINTSLSLNLTQKREHLKIGWQEITTAALAALAKNECVAILWGSHAQKVGSVFPVESQVSAVHPSPLSAYRGFFGSKPFSKCNQILISKGQKPIDWKLR